VVVVAVVVVVVVVVVGVVVAVVVVTLVVCVRVRVWVRGGGGALNCGKRSETTVWQGMEGRRQGDAPAHSKQITTERGYACRQRENMTQRCATRERLACEGGVCVRCIKCARTDREPRWGELPLRGRALRGRLQQHDEHDPRASLTTNRVQRPHR